jgi:signal transduction histidine kinase/ActR/RegA family two-component response regulator
MRLGLLARFRHPVGLATVLSVALVATAFGGTIWRYEHAHANERAARRQADDRVRVEEATQIFWHQREAIDEYLITGRPSVLQEVATLQRAFVRATAGPRANGNIENRLIAGARLSNGQLSAQFEQRRGNGMALDLRTAAIVALHPFEARVLLPLREALAFDAARQQELTRAADVASRQARFTALIGALIALASGIGFAAYAVSLLRRGRRQSDHLRSTLDERELMHAELHDQERQLRQSNRLEAVGTLAGGVAHDVNNVLQAINGFSDLALSAVMPQQQRLRADIEQIQLATTRAAGLTSRLLAFSRRQKLEPASIDLPHLVENLIAMLNPLVGERIELVLDAKASTSAVFADPGQMEQIVTNLVVNARDSMPNGGQITIGISNVEHPDDETSPPVPAGGHVLLAVTDTGTGMDPETIAQAFDPFFTTKGQSEGTGLGLATVYGIVTQSAGSIRVSSELGHGTTVAIYLPVATVAAHEPTVLERERPTRSNPGSETILLVEDDDVIRKLLREILRNDGYRVITASEGAEALTRAADFPDPIDLLVTDMVMPGIGGRELSDTLRRNNVSLKTIYISGYTQDEQLYRQAEAGELDFLQKPFSPSALLHIARRVLERDVVKT